MSLAHPEPTFRPFDPDGELRVYVRNLPHWRQPHATYFVTFRQGDSIPASVLAEWRDVQRRWYQAHGLQAHSLNPLLRDTSPEQFASAYRKIPRRARRAMERRQARLLHKELDRCHGSCLLRYPEPRSEVVQSLRYFHGDRLWLGDFVLMPNHVHAIITPLDDWKLEELLASIKKWTSQLIGQWRKQNGVLLDPESRASASHNRRRYWQHESYDRIIQDAEELARFRHYIATNPAKANLARGHFEYSAVDWLDQYAPVPQ